MKSRRAKRQGQFRFPRAQKAGLQMWWLSSHTRCPDRADEPNRISETYCSACTPLTGASAICEHCWETELMLSWATQAADRLIGMDDLTEPHFLRHPPGLTVGEIAALTGAELQDVTNHSQRMTNVAPIDLAEAGDLTFVDNARFAKALTSTRAGAILISEHFRMSRSRVASSYCSRRSLISASCWWLANFILTHCVPRRFSKQRASRRVHPSIPPPNSPAV